MKSKTTAVWFLGFLLAAGFAGVWQLQKKIDASQQANRVEMEELAFRSGAAVRRLSLEYAPLMGAIYWTRAVQYYGEKHRLKQKGLDLLWPLLDIATTLDPHLLVAYRFGSTFLGEKPPTGAGRPDLAIQLLERGIQANPDEWWLYYDMGFVYYFELHDYRKAAAAFEQGSKNPKAYIWMKVLAAKVAAEGESLETSYFLWQQVYDTATDPMIKQNAEEHLKLVRADRDIQEINRLADAYEKKTGHRPGKIGELLQAGLLKAMPRDPEGYPYVIGENGKADLNLNSPLLEKKLMDRKL